MIKKALKLVKKIEDAKKVFEAFQAKCPHTHTTPIEVMGIPGGIAWWEQCNRCDKLVRLTTNPPTCTTFFSGEKPGYIIWPGDCNG